MTESLADAEKFAKALKLSNQKRPDLLPFWAPYITALHDEIERLRNELDGKPSQPK